MGALCPMSRPYSTILLTIVPMLFGSAKCSAIILRSALGAAISFLEKISHMIQTHRANSGILQNENTSTMRNRAVMTWLFVFAFIVAFLVVFGGFVRLTRSGLSITEWNPISGSMPPISQQAWQDEFAKYQQTPEFKQINFNMDLQEYKFIFYMEWIH